MKYECKRCGETADADRWEPELPDTDCRENDGGPHTWAEESDSYV